MSTLFDTTRIKTLTLPNRIFRSATFEGMAEDNGAVTPRLAEFLVELAQGEVGLIISGHTYVRREGQAGPRQMGLYEDSLTPPLAALVREIHAAGGRIAIQLAHAGLRADAALSGLMPIGPSEYEQEGGVRAVAATAQELDALVDAYGQAARRAKEAGADAVQLHSAHGYLLSQFLSPVFNTREDGYGGSLENRARMPLRVVAAVRKALGPEFPLLVKLNTEDFLPGGLSPEESLRVAGWLAEASVDCIELSGGVVRSPSGVFPARKGLIKGPEEEGYYRSVVRRYKESVGVPIALVGGVRSFDVADALVREGAVDYISLCRPLIREPGLVKRWREGDLRSAKCLSDNLCYGPAFDGRGLFCVVEEAERKKQGRRD
jgi:2,4-dienoyl-CoA reductase-like NADH-dependent reductase (Old Yellow Enzyme family)